MKVELKYDLEADAAYLRLSDSEIIVGLEVLHAKRHLANDTLVAEE